MNKLRGSAREPLACGAERCHEAALHPRIVLLLYLLM